MYIQGSYKLCEKSYDLINQKQFVKNYIILLSKFIFQSLCNMRLEMHTQNGMCCDINKYVIWLVLHPQRVQTVYSYISTR